MKIEEKLAAMRLVLPSELSAAPGAVRLPFAKVRVRGNRAFVSGHGPQNQDGTLAGPNDQGRQDQRDEPRHLHGFPCPARISNGASWRRVVFATASVTSRWTT